MAVQGGAKSGWGLHGECREECGVECVYCSHIKISTFVVLFSNMSSSTLLLSFTVVN